MIIGLSDRSPRLIGTKDPSAVVCHNVMSSSEYVDGLVDDWVYEYGKIAVMKRGHFRFSMTSQFSRE